MAVIAGIGTNRGLFPYRAIPMCYCDYYFSCFNDGALTYGPSSSCSYIWPNTIPTSVETSRSETSIDIYPNPFNGELTIKTIQQASVALYDVTGQLVLQRDMQNATTISTSHLPSGLYLLKLTDKNGQVVETRKLLKD
jgi:hypothetical protein